MKNKASIIGLVLGILATPVAILFGAASTGAGHGDYFAAKLLFPITMLSTIAFGSITAPFILLAFAQFPIYGWVIGSGFGRGARHLRLWLPVAIHFAALALNFVIPNPNFS